MCVCVTGAVTNFFVTYLDGGGVERLGRGRRKKFDDSNENVPDPFT